MATPYPFADPACWSDAYYELDMQYARGIGATRLLQAIHTLWHQPLLEGPVANRWSAQVPPYTPLALSSGFEEMAHLNGLLHLPHGAIVGCHSEVLRYGFDATEEAAAQSDCALRLSIPETMIYQAYAVERGVADGTPSWEYPLDRLLMGVAESIPGGTLRLRGDRRGGCPVVRGWWDIPHRGDAREVEFPAHASTGDAPHTEPHP